MLFPFSILLGAFAVQSGRREGWILNMRTIMFPSSTHTHLPNMCRQFDSIDRIRSQYMQGSLHFHLHHRLYPLQLLLHVGFYLRLCIPLHFNPSLQDSNENTVVSIVELPMMKMTMIEKTAIIGRIWPWIG